MTRFVDGDAAAGSSAEAATGADIVTTRTADKALARVLTPDMVEPDDKSLF